jgi:hypothetical protein
MTSIATQTTTFLPKTIQVLQKRELKTRWFNKMAKIHAKAIKQVSKNNTLTKAEKDAKRAADRAAKKAEREAKRAADRAAKKAEREAKKAHDKALKKEAKEAKRASDKAAKKAEKAVEKAVAKEERQKRINKKTAGANTPIMPSTPITTSNTATITTTKLSLIHPDLLVE